MQGECESGKAEFGSRGNRRVKGRKQRGTGGGRAGSRGKSAGEGPEGEQTKSGEPRA